MSISVAQKNMLDMFPTVLLQLVCEYASVTDLYSHKLHQHIDMNQYFIETCIENQISMTEAISNGYLDVVAFLWYYKSSHITIFSITRAAANGHLNVIQFLHSQNIKLSWNSAMIDASRYGHYDIVTFLYNISNTDCSSALEQACIANHVDIVNFFIQNGVKLSQSSMTNIAKNGNVHLVKYLHKIGFKCYDYVIENIVRCRSYDIIEFLLSVGYKSSTTAMVDAIINGCDLNIVKLLRTNSIIQTSQALTTAKEQCRLDIIKFIESTQYD